MNVYAELTKAFNKDSFRAILSSGQAVVMHKLAIMSKDGDWILREQDDVMSHVLQVLSGKHAHYRFGAPLDIRWMAGGWSSHFEFRQDILRVRTDFVTRPPRIAYRVVQDMWNNPDPGPIPVVDVKNLAELKKTNREKDYAVIGELSRLLTDPEDALLLSRSARDIISLAARHPGLVSRLLNKRPLLAEVPRGLGSLEVALDAERRTLIHANESRLRCYRDASMAWASLWPKVTAHIQGLPLDEAHKAVVAEAKGVLPMEPWEMS